MKVKLLRGFGFCHTLQKPWVKLGTIVDCRFSEDKVAYDALAFILNTS